MASSVNKIGAVNTNSSDGGGDGTREGKVRTRRKCAVRIPPCVACTKVGLERTEDVLQVRPHEGLNGRAKVSSDGSEWMTRGR